MLASSTTTIAQWDGPQLAAVLRGALARLQHEAPLMNALNVFPVPDGDTGTNMTSTLQAALAGLRGDEDTAAAVMQAVARGAMMGARGNSGVILSQLLRGLARGLDGRATVDAATLAGALELAVMWGYRAVTHPVEGTMLTVMRHAAEAALPAATHAESPADVLAVALNAARESLRRTPELLPVLREAGVVDSGGHGIVALLDGALRVARGQPPVDDEEDQPAHTRASWAVNTDHLHVGGGSQYGYCTEFLVRGERLPLAAVRDLMGQFGDSLLVVGDDEIIRIHIHVQDPGAPLSAAVRYGTLLQVKVDNMEEQFRQFIQAAEQPDETGPPDVPEQVTPRPLAVVAVCAGDGLAAAARSLGATVVAGGQTMNPSAADLLAGAEASGGETVILLPNNRNILLAARQAAGLSAQRVLIVPTTTAAQGIAALIALPPEATPDEAVAAMTAAAECVRTLEVTRATRTATVNGIAVQQGQALALLDDVPVAAADSIIDAVTAALDRIAPDTVQLVTIYPGADATDDMTALIEAAVRARFADAVVETVPGGQPHYPYMLALEE